MQALLPFPSVLEMMASDMNWTTQIGNAFLAQQPEVMDAVQRERRKAGISAISEATRRSWWAAGPTSPSCRSIRLSSPCRTTIRRSCSSRRVRDSSSAARSASASALPLAHFSGPGAGARAASIGAGTGCLSTTRPWGRTWENRGAYVHPYEGIRRPEEGARRPAEQHRLEERSPVSATRLDAAKSRARSTEGAKHPKLSLPEA